MGAVLLAAVLAPTDAGLGAPVVTSPRVPARIRRLLSVESGLNDGIVLPIVLFTIAGLAGSGEQPGPDEAVLAPLAGAGIGALIVGLAEQFGSRLAHVHLTDGTSSGFDEHSIRAGLGTTPGSARRARRRRSGRGSRAGGA